VILTSFQNFLWIAGTTLKLILCVLVFARGLHRRLPLFGLYAVMLVAEAVVVRWTYHHFGYSTRAAFYAYWSSLAVVLIARALAVAELCWTSMRNSPAIWMTTRRWLAFVALVMLIYAVFSAATNNSPVSAFLLTVQRSLDLGISVILVALLGLGIRFQVSLGAVEKKIALGFVVHSTFQILNSAFMQRWTAGYFRWWVSASVVSLEVAMLIWIAALLRPLPPPAPPPALLPEEESATLLAEILEQMRRIAEEMKRIARSKWK
jgi:hypothetical protein